MFRKMRRFRQLLPENETMEILKSAFSGTLALSGDDGYPYAVPLNFVLYDGALYFHCAKEGYKADCVRQSDKVCFSVVAMAENLPEKLTALYKSVTVFGRIRFLEDETEKRGAAFALGKKYAPDATDEAIRKEIEGSFSHLAMLKLTIEHATGKQSIELVR